MTKIRDEHLEEISQDSDEESYDPEVRAREAKQKRLDEMGCLTVGLGAGCLPIIVVTVACVTLLTV